MDSIIFNKIILLINTIINVINKKREYSGIFANYQLKVKENSFKILK